MTCLSLFLSLFCKSISINSIPPFLCLPVANPNSLLTGNVTVCSLLPLVWHTSKWLALLTAQWFCDKPQVLCLEVCPFKCHSIFCQRSWHIVFRGSRLVTYVWWCFAIVAKNPDPYLNWGRQNKGQDYVGGNIGSNKSFGAQGTIGMWFRCATWRYNMVYLITFSGCLMYMGKMRIKCNLVLSSPVPELLYTLPCFRVRLFLIFRVTCQSIIYLSCALELVEK